MKTWKTARPEELPAVVFIMGGEALKNNLLRGTWNEERIPLYWVNSMNVFIFKKGTCSDCNNRQGSGLFPVVIKALSMMTLRRLTPVLEKICEQAGHRSGRICID